MQPASQHDRPNDSGRPPRPPSASSQRPTHSNTASPAAHGGGATPPQSQSPAVVPAASHPPSPIDEALHSMVTNFTTRLLERVERRMQARRDGGDVGTPSMATPSSQSPATAAITSLAVDVGYDAIDRALDKSATTRHPPHHQHTASQNSASSASASSTPGSGHGIAPLGPSTKTTTTSEGAHASSQPGAVTPQQQQQQQNPAASREANVTPTTTTTTTTNNQSSNAPSPLPQNLSPPNPPAAGHSPAVIKFVDAFVMDILSRSMRARKRDVVSTIVGRFAEAAATCRFHVAPMRSESAARCVQRWLLARGSHRALEVQIRAATRSICGCIVENFIKALVASRVNSRARWGSAAARALPYIQRVGRAQRQRAALRRRIVSLTLVQTILRVRTSYTVAMPRRLNQFRDSVCVVHRAAMQAVAVRVVAGRLLSKFDRLATVLQATCRSLHRQYVIARVGVYHYATGGDERATRRLLHQLLAFRPIPSATARDKVTVAARRLQALLIASAAAATDAPETIGADGHSRRQHVATALHHHAPQQRQGGGGTDISAAMVMRPSTPAAALLSVAPSPHQSSVARVTMAKWKVDSIIYGTAAVRKRLGPRPGELQALPAATTRPHSSPQRRDPAGSPPRRGDQFNQPHAQNAGASPSRRDDDDGDGVRRPQTSPTPHRHDGDGVRRGGGEGAGPPQAKRTLQASKWSPTRNRRSPPSATTTETGDHRPPSRPHTSLGRPPSALGGVRVIIGGDAARTPAPSSALQQPKPSVSATSSAQQHHHHFQHDSSTILAPGARERGAVALRALQDVQGIYRRNYLCDPNIPDARTSPTKATSRAAKSSHHRSGHTTHPKKDGDMTSKKAPRTRRDDDGPSSTSAVHERQHAHQRSENGGGTTTTRLRSPSPPLQHRTMLTPSQLLQQTNDAAAALVAQQSIRWR